MKRTWFQALHRYDPHQIGRAIEACQESVKTPPTLPQFIELVKGCYVASGQPQQLEHHRTASMFPDKSEAEVVADREYPKPADGFGNWWACRIVRLAQQNDYPHTLGLMNAMRVLGLESIWQLAEKWPPYDGDKEAAAERSAMKAA
jgi:hypothetical protein